MGQATYAVRNLCSAWSGDRRRSPQHPHIRQFRNGCGTTLGAGLPTSPKRSTAGLQAAESTPGSGDLRSAVCAWSGDQRTARGRETSAQRGVGRPAHSAGRPAHSAEGRLACRRRGFAAGRRKTRGQAPRLESPIILPSLFPFTFCLLTSHHASTSSIAVPSAMRIGRPTSEMFWRSGSTPAARQKVASTSPTPTWFSSTVVPSALVLPYA